MSKRDTYRYVMREGRDVVQYGVTNDPEARVNEHAGDRKRFTSVTVVGPAVTRETALEWERRRINRYKQAHGRRPRYNKI